MKALAGIGLASVLLACVAFGGAPGSLEHADSAFHRNASPAAPMNGKSDAVPLRLLGQSYFIKGDLKRAAEVLEQAAQADPSNSDTYLLLGRVWGRRAETAFAAVAPVYATRARTNFEKAVQLNPSNWPALDDLFEYYLDAPAFLGGGPEKAARIADRIEKRDAAEAALDRARIAEQRRDYPVAEAQYRRAVELAPQQAGRLLDLARFLARRGRAAESDAAYARASAIAPNLPKVLTSTPEDSPRRDAQRSSQRTAGS